jgi:transcriptional regulator with XRE-family HTH domain
LRREEVAVLAGLSPAWYTYLEQGRDIRPSAEVLASLARVLRLTQDERRHLVELARRGSTENLTAETSAEELVELLVEAAADSPFPAYGADLYCNIIACNAATAEYYTDFESRPPDQRNMMRWLLTDPEAKQRLPLWSTDVPDVVARWRAMVVGYEIDSRLNELLAELRQESADFSRWWDGHNVALHRSRIRVLAHPRLGEQKLRLIVAQSPEFTPCIVVFHVPLTAR